MLQANQNNIIELKEGFCFDMYNETLFYHDEFIKLRAKEVALLKLLLENPQRFVTYTEIENIVWETESMSKDALKIAINGKKCSYSTTPSSYVSLDRKWKKGDTVEIKVPAGILNYRILDVSR